MSKLLFSRLNFAIMALVTGLPSMATIALAWSSKKKLISKGTTHVLGESPWHLTSQRKSLCYQHIFPKSHHNEHNFGVKVSTPSA